MMAAEIPVPTGEIAHRELHFFWIADHSGSMLGKKIATLNQAIREALPAIRAAVASHPEVNIKMRAIKFSDNADWHVGPDPVPVDKFIWPELTASGVTATARAIRLLSSQLKPQKLPGKQCPPVCILISDGCCTDPPEDYAAAIDELTQLQFGKRAVRLAISVFDDDPHSNNEAELHRFLSHKEIGVLRADTVQQLVQHIQWASVAGTSGASAGRTKAGAPADEFVMLPSRPTDQPVVQNSPGTLETFDGGFVDP